MIGREIAKRCKGLPLAANVIGGLLLGCKSEEEWSFVSKNRLSDVEGGERILKILKLSYDHLPSPSLKKCFAYCSIFRKGDWIDKQELIEMWMAEGFLKADRRNEMESDVGDKFIKVLLHNSLLLVSKRDEYGNVRHCVMHDLVHGVASFILGSFDGITPPPYMFHVSGWGEAGHIPKQVAKHLRTLVLDDCDYSKIVFSDFESLRVLTLIDYHAKELPSWIRKLIHLRSLNISETFITKLPDWIGELHHLQTLRAESVRLKKMPTTLEYFTNLSHVHLRFSHLPAIPAMMGRLTGLQALDLFRVGDKKGYRIEELGSLNNLKENLEIWDLDKVHGKEEAEKANMSHKSKLLHLRLRWGYRSEGEKDNDESVLEGLQPHPNLHKLEIKGYKGNKFPSWIEKVPLNKLIKLTLSDCYNCEELPSLDHLPNLKSLKLEGFKKVRFIDSSFTSLTSLSIEDFEALECLPDWLFNNNPNLSELEIERCPKLRELPDGLQTLHSLERLGIWYCRNLKSIGNISGGRGRGESKAGTLRKLWIVDCEQLMELPRQMVESWASSLESVTLRELSSLENLPTLFECLAKSAIHRLTHLSIVDVPNFMAICSSGESWPLENLLTLRINCSKDWSREKSSDGIMEKVDGILQSCCNSLTMLTLRGMEDWECLPQSIQHLTSLCELRLTHFGVEELPEWLGSLPSLKELTLTSCSKLRRLNLNLSSTTQLHKIYVNYCPELDVGSVLCSNPNVNIEEYN